MIELAALTFPNIDPEAFSIGPVSVKWYGLAYMAGLILGWLYVRRLLETPHLWKTDKPPLTIERIDDLLLYMTLAIIVGGRLGQVLLYEPGYYFANPIEILKTWRGGMSFHGALIASAIAIFVFARKFKVSPRTVMDLCCAAVPFGLFFGRIANFINSEHWGRTTDAAIGMVFPNGGPEPRHPSQLYEAALEGVALFTIINFLTLRYDTLRRPGMNTGVFLVCYGLFRALLETVREPDAHMPEALRGFITMGMLLSLPMIAFGVWLIRRALKQPKLASA